MNAGAPEFDPAAGKPGQALNVCYFRRAENVDAVVAQIAFIIEGSGIAVVARWMQLGANAQARAVSE
jgi:hypothetical protein